MFLSTSQSLKTYLYLVSNSVRTWKVESRYKNSQKLILLAFIFLISSSNISLILENKACSLKYAISSKSLTSIDFKFFLSNSANNSYKYAIYLVVQGSILLILSFSSQVWYLDHKLVPSIFFPPIFFYELPSFPIFQKLIIFLMSFAGKRILVTGGNGYLGNYFAARFVQQQATVMALSRSGTKHTHPENDRIEWLKGNILDPTPLKDKINSADIIVHAIGTLFDTSVTQRAEPGQKGTYEQINRDTFSSLLSVVDQPKKILYISSASHPPFLQRYLSTKYEAQQMLQNSNHEGYSLRPGFIYSWKHRFWSIPIKVSIDMWNIVYPYLEKATFIFSEKSKPGRLLRQFKQGENISLEELGNSVLELSLNGGKYKVNEVPHLINLSTKFANQHLK